MADTRTHNRLYVSTDGNAGPYIMVPVEQLPEVQSILGETGSLIGWTNRRSLWTAAPRSPW